MHRHFSFVFVLTAMGCLFGSPCPLVAIQFCHDYTLYRLTNGAEHRNGTSAQELHGYLRKQHAPVPGIADGAGPLRPGDVLFLGDDHSGFVNDAGTIDHFIQVPGRRGQPYATLEELPRGPIEKDYNGKKVAGGLFLGDTLEQFLSRRHLESRPPLLVYRRSPVDPGTGDEPPQEPAVAGAPPGPGDPASPPMVTVPKVLGFPLQMAIDELRKAKLLFDLAVGEDPPANAKPFVVYGQEPEAGTQLAPQSSVTIVFATRSGEKEPQVAVPNVVRMLKEEAEQALKAADLNPNPVGEKVDRPPNARHKEVYEQSPDDQQMVAKGATVTFLYYAGIRVPDVMGMRRQEAELTISKLLLKPESEPGDERAPRALDAGNVYEQKPAGQEWLVEGEPVHIKFYKELGGFQDGDGALVSPRFATAIVLDGKAGARSGIGDDSRAKDPAKRVREYYNWGIWREPDSAHAQKRFESVSEYFKDYTSHDPQMRASSKTTRVGPWDKFETQRYWEADNPHLYEGATYCRIAIHREVFWIFLRMRNPDESHDFGDEPNQIMAKSIKLIDLRFPPEGVK